MTDAGAGGTPIICPTCRDEAKPVKRGSEFFPFCCRGCRDRDLAAWVEEKYRVDAGPAHPLDVEAEES